MPAGVYLHIPFCKSRCSYCDFATDVYRSGDAVERYVDALCREIDAFDGPGGNASVNERGGESVPSSEFGVSSSASGARPDEHHELGTRNLELGTVYRPIATLPDGRVPARREHAFIDTIYFGGGTPSLLTPVQVERILSSVHSAFDIAPEREITMEMNPATVTRETLAAYRELGVNRASFGVQTFNDRDLKLLARGHDANDARHTFRLLRDAGFANISFDLIAGLPGQTIEDWKRNLDEAVSMRPEHLSLYLLEIHEGTPLAEQLRAGRRPMPDEELAAEMYELMIDTLVREGYRQYEISNFAKPGIESRHNSKYWRLDPVFGFGVSAHSFEGGQRYANERDTARYVELIERSGSAEVFRETTNIASESAFLGLRLTEGIDLADHERRFGIDLRIKVGELEDSGLVEVESGRLRLTRKGMLFSNEVFAEFV